MSKGSILTPKRGAWMLCENKKGSGVFFYYSVVGNLLFHAR